MRYGGQGRGGGLIYNLNGFPKERCQNFNPRITALRNEEQLLQ